ncbi:hypothetical protein H6F74_20115 [Trichocoleus sp. FACHB-90]|uniref:hypothetical protein n=1 Tax=Cyanophyceae TaxID=3028117 RepID=UPI0016839E7A|nr:hypothetical protein [Trichocoleus sp. FACHB-90]MBD1928536.1 hypothetical protein [Trichocoleus sp. FACHB-90]
MVIKKPLQPTKINVTEFSFNKSNHLATEQANGGGKASDDGGVGFFYFGLTGHDIIPDAESY